MNYRRDPGPAAAEPRDRLDQLVDTLLIAAEVLFSQKRISGFSHLVDDGTRQDVKTRMRSFFTIALKSTVQLSLSLDIIQIHGGRKVDKI